MRRHASICIGLLLGLAALPAVASDGRLTITRDAGDAAAIAARSAEVGLLTISRAARRPATRSVQAPPEGLAPNPATDMMLDMETSRRPARPLPWPTNLPVNSGRGTGGYNVATVLASGDNGTVTLFQDSAGLGPGNAAQIELQGSGTARVDQTGSGNVADLLVGRGALSGSILQNGTNNRAELAVSGEGASGEIHQIGNDNQHNLAVAGPGVSASYTVVGDGLTTVDPAGASVLSNGGSVQITQYLN